jgi:hypothetical protein
VFDAQIHAAAKTQLVVGIIAGAVVLAVVVTVVQVVAVTVVQAVAEMVVELNRITSEFRFTI